MSESLGVMLNLQTLQGSVLTFLRRDKIIITVQTTRISYEICQKKHFENGLLQRQLQSKIMCLVFLRHGIYRPNLWQLATRHR